MDQINSNTLTIRPLTPDYWGDFVDLFGPKGAYGGCWCMWWRLSRSEFEKGQGECNRNAMKKIVDSGQIPGLLAYNKSEPIGWCSIAPRHQFSSLERSRILKRIDDEAVWSLICFFIHKNYRGQNILEKLIQGAIAYVKLNGGKIIEAYPSDIQRRNAAPVSSFMGIPKVFERVGFKEVGRPSKSKIIMRYHIE